MEFTTVPALNSARLPCPASMPGFSARLPCSASVPGFRAGFPVPHAQFCQSCPSVSQQHPLAVHGAHRDCYLISEVGAPERSLLARGLPRPDCGCASRPDCRAPFRTVSLLHAALASHNATRTARQINSLHRHAAISAAADYRLSPADLRKVVDPGMECS